MRIFRSFCLVAYWNKQAAAKQCWEKPPSEPRRSSHTVTSLALPALSSSAPPSRAARLRAFRTALDRSNCPTRRPAPALRSVPPSVRRRPLSPPCPNLSRSARWRRDNNRTDATTTRQRRRQATTKEEEPLPFYNPEHKSQVPNSVTEKTGSDARRSSTKIEHQYVAHRGRRQWRQSEAQYEALRCSTTDGHEVHHLRAPSPYAVPSSFLGGMSGAQYIDLLPVSTIIFHSPALKSCSEISKAMLRLPVTSPSPNALSSAGSPHAKGQELSFPSSLPPPATTLALRHQNTKPS
ncbi:unnamed protein product [Cyclocybe aegerita]|uniref:Uncharacterized protein n=1 Tax=Cyclocybe aegerita TaxID=1973307 RepID=A0A8S0WWU6_CYCAE|nr:unnamed protein product [Cyclocybe aegerita]